MKFTLRRFAPVKSAPLKSAPVASVRITPIGWFPGSAPRLAFLSLARANFVLLIAEMSRAPVRSASESVAPIRIAAKRLAPRKLARVKSTRYITARSRVALSKLAPVATASDSVAENICALAKLARSSRERDRFALRKSSPLRSSADRSLSASWAGDSLVARPSTDTTWSRVSRSGVGAVISAAASSAGRLPARPTPARPKLPQLPVTATARTVAAALIVMFSSRQHEPSPGPRLERRFSQSTT